ncbi:hypothetical protein [Streptomyces sp. NPDC058254]|uniref:hypothetical protein n=1 Tax=Streptomyces sp. NPDC058254 TaxID=3346406 RepID=UPI0036E72E86
MTTGQEDHTMSDKRRKGGTVEDGRELYHELFGRTNTEDDQNDATADDETGSEDDRIEAGRKLYRELLGNPATDMRPGTRRHGTDPFGPPAA